MYTLPPRAETPSWKENDGDGPVLAPIHWPLGDSFTIRLLRCRRHKRVVLVDADVARVVELNDPVAEGPDVPRFGVVRVEADDPLFPVSATTIVPSGAVSRPDG